MPMHRRTSVAYGLLMSLSMNLLSTMLGLLSLPHRLLLSLLGMAMSNVHRAIGIERAIDISRIVDVERAIDISRIVRVLGPIVAIAHLWPSKAGWCIGAASATARPKHN